MKIAMELMPTYRTRGIPVPDCKGGLPRWQLRRLIDYIQNSLSDRFTVRELVRVTNLSGYHLGKAFKRSTGLTLHQYVICQRIYKAQYLLLNTHYPLSEIAGATGFASQSHFTRVFRQYAQMTPGEWRRSINS